MSTLRRCLLPAVGLFALLIPSAGATTIPHFCYSMVRSVEAAAVPVGVGVTTSASASSSAGCAPAVQNGVRGFLMTETWTGTVSGSSGLFSYSTNCGPSGDGPIANECGGTRTWFCAAPGTSPCYATAPSVYVFIFNDQVPLDNASAQSVGYELRCQYLA